MSLQLDLTKDEWWYCKLLAKGQLPFEEMTFDQKLLVYEANIDISDTVPVEQLEEFEDELARRGYFGTKEQMKQRAVDTKRKFKV